MSPNPAGRRILLFIPMYNCRAQITRVIAQITPAAAAFIDEVLVVDNRSTDGGRQTAAAALTTLVGVRTQLLLNDSNYGLGGSHKVAFQYARQNGFDYCIVLHGDDQGSIDGILPLLSSGAHLTVDCLLGARFMRGSTLQGYSLPRTLGNRVFNLLYSLVTGRRIYDLGSGLNLYRVAALDRVDFLRCADNLTFNYHMIVRSIAANLRIAFFPIRWREDDQVSNVKLVSQSLQVARIALEYFVRRKRYLAADYAIPRSGGYTATAVVEGSSVHGGSPAGS